MEFGRQYLTHMHSNMHGDNNPTCFTRLKNESKQVRFNRGNHGQWSWMNCKRATYTFWLQLVYFFFASVKLCHTDIQLLCSLTKISWCLHNSTLKLMQNWKDHLYREAILLWALPSSHFELVKLAYIKISCEISLYHIHRLHVLGDIVKFRGWRCQRNRKYQDSQDNWIAWAVFNCHCPKWCCNHGLKDLWQDWQLKMSTEHYTTPNQHYKLQMIHETPWLKIIFMAHISIGDIRLHRHLFLLTI